MMQINNNSGNAARQAANDLRKSHFTLGNSNPNAGNSEYLDKFRNSVTTLKEPQDSNLDLRASHIQIGQKPQADMYMTIKQKDFKPYPDADTAVLDEEKRANLRAHHFTLGNHGNNFQTISNVEFGKKSAEIHKQKQEQEEQRNKMRRHNFNFGETAKMIYSSVYDKEFNKEFSPEALKQSLSSEALKQKVLDLRKSNVILGGHAQPVASVNHQDFKGLNPSESINKIDSLTVRRSHISLGENKTDYQSMSQAFFVEHNNAEKAPSTKELSYDLKLTHFTLGSDQTKRASLMNDSFISPPADSKPAQNIIRPSNISIGNEGEKLTNKTTYSTTLIPHQVQQSTANELKGRDSKSSLIIGGHKPLLISESQASFPKYDKKFDSLDQALQENLRKSHFVFNEVKPQYITSSHSIHTTKALPIHTSLSMDLAGKLRSTNFQLGHQLPTFESSNQSIHVNTHGKAALLDPKVEKDLRSHHYEHGDSKWDLDTVTEYRGSFVAQGAQIMTYWLNNRPFFVNE